jgi:hypothetical protein
MAWLPEGAPTDELDIAVYKIQEKKWQWNDNCHLFDATVELNIL